MVSQPVQSSILQSNNFPSSGGKKDIVNACWEAWFLDNFLKSYLTDSHSKQWDPVLKVWDLLGLVQHHTYSSAASAKAFRKTNRRQNQKAKNSAKEGPNQEREMLLRLWQNPVIAWPPFQQHCFWSGRTLLSCWTESPLAEIVLLKE